MIHYPTSFTAFYISYNLAMKTKYKSCVAISEIKFFRLITS